MVWICCPNIESFFAKSTSWSQWVWDEKYLALIAWVVHFWRSPKWTRLFTVGRLNNVGISDYKPPKAFWYETSTLFNNMSQVKMVEDSVFNSDQMCKWYNISKLNINIILTILTAKETLNQASWSIPHWAYVFSQAPGWACGMRSCC